MMRMLCVVVKSSSLFSNVVLVLCALCFYMQRLKTIRLFKKKNIDKGTRKGMIERRNKNRAKNKKEPVFRTYMYPVVIV